MRYNFHVSINIIKRNVKIPIVVVNRPNFFDLVQPAREIMAISETIPKRNKITPTILGSIKSVCITFIGYPSVVIIRSFVIAKTVIKNEPAAKVAVIIIIFDKRVFVSETKRFAITAIENPPSNELIVIICSASLFQYSNVISIIIFRRIFQLIFVTCIISKE
ncbi:membrane protein [Christiangramia forsetii KT0803]|uniref:Membrane protein n=1 Tax=Christiangramia forsetii (strain DSM 17595 / CGMCC 1.15422 / KT0803) TaxID=411154 RepID=A0M3K4_CHRFK|nr:membrane protein [Christiangramia forsetii KT0803]